MSAFCGLDLTEDRVEGFLSRAKRRDDGKYVASLDEDEPLSGRTTCGIERAEWVEVEDSEDILGSARMLRSDEANDQDNVFLRIGGVLTSAGRDDNGVTLKASALATLPQDFIDRTTMLFNHDMDTPIGRIINTRVLRANGSAPARAVISADVHRSAIHGNTQMPFAELIRSGILNRYSFSWSVLRGEIVFDLSSETDIHIDEDEETLTIPFGRDFSPEINVFAMRATEPSVVSVPAKADAELTVARQFARSLDAVRGNWLQSHNGLLVPVSTLRHVETVDRPFNPVLAKVRIVEWAASTGSKLNLNKVEDFARFAQAFAGHENDGRRVEDWYGLHCDVVDGGLVWNVRAVDHCLADLATDERSAARARMCRELGIVHAIEIDV